MYMYSSEEEEQKHKKHCTSSSEDVPGDLKGRKVKFLTGRPECISFKNAGGRVDGGESSESDNLMSFLGAYNAGESQQALDRDFASAATNCYYGYPPLYDTKQAPRSIMWCNSDFAFEEPSLSYGAYGNEATSECIYSAAAIVIDVPPYNQRKLA